MEGLSLTHNCLDMELFREARVTVLVGAFGCGKTELAVNFAMRMNDAGRDVALVDIDILKPMFRSRDKRLRLSELGVRVVSSVADYEDADIPALSPAIYGVIEDQSQDVVIDVGGDDDGARVLGRFRNVLERAGYEMLYVVNTRRPFSSTPEEIVNMVVAVEQASRLKCTALVSNTNLGSESSVELVKEGLDIT
jgi:RecA/RadA recombinase